MGNQLIAPVSDRYIERLKVRGLDSCYKCNKEFEINDRLIRHMRHGRKGHAPSRYYHEDCYNRMFY